MAKIYATKIEAMSEREKKNMNLSRNIASQWMVLLQNDGTLPLTGIKKGALFGGVARRTV